VKTSLGRTRPENRANTRDPRVAVTLKQLRTLEYSARGFSFLPRQPAQSVLNGRRRSRLRGRGLNFEELRHYHPGDDIRSLDWKVTNRTGKPHLRVYTEERERSVLLLVDQRSNMFFGSRRAMKSVVAAEVAALSAWRVLASGDRIGGIVLGDEHCHSIPPRRSRDSVLGLLRQIERCNNALHPGRPPRGPQLAVALDLAARSLSHDALVIYIGDGFGWDQRTEKLVKRIALHNDFVAVNVFDPAEQELPELEQFVVSDGEMQLAVVGNRNRLRERYREQYREEQGQMRDTLRRYGVAVIPVNTVEPPLQQLLRALGGLPR
jgi:uncharacterized protein (DUF58 family)